MYVEDHHDDLGDDLSGLGDDLQFLIADVTPSDWTDDEDDQEAESIVLHWTQPGLYLANFKEAMRMPALRSKEIELAETEAISALTTTDVSENQTIDEEDLDIFVSQ